MSDLNKLVTAYGLFVGVKMKKGEDILASLTPEKCDLLHSATGITTEAGELADAVKKHVFYNKPLDQENLVEELGDLMFYSMNILVKLGIPLEDVLRQNMAKLGIRYAEGYSDAEAAARADKQ